jgi:hypothetical protein
VPEYGVRAKRGDFEPLISEDLFYRVQAVSWSLLASWVREIEIIQTRTPWDR